MEIHKDSENRDSAVSCQQSTARLRKEMSGSIPSLRYDEFLLLSCYRWSTTGTSWGGKDTAGGCAGGCSEASSAPQTHPVTSL